MARPIKEGLDYFPFDVDFFSDTKIKVLKSNFGTDGIAVYIYILTQIYKDKGYYVIADDDFIGVMASDLGMNVQKIGLILNFLLGRSLFDNTLFRSDKVLTSRSIQLRFQEAKKTAKRPIEIESGFWLLKKEETKGFIKYTHFLDKSEKNYSKSEKNEGFSIEKSLKESKVKESKGNKSKERVYGTHANVYLSDEQLENLKSLFSDWQDKIDNLSSYMASSGKSYANHYATILKWDKEDKEKQEEAKTKGTGFSNFTSTDDYDYNAIERRAMGKK